MSAVTLEFPYNFVHTPHTVSQNGTSDEQKQTLDTTYIEWHVANPSVQTAPIGVVEATASRLLQEMRVFLTRNKVAAAESALLSLDAIFIGKPYDVASVRMLVHDIGIGKSIATFDIGDLSSDDIDELP